MTTYTLPDLSYEHAALEPHIDPRTMELHHGAHQADLVTAAEPILVIDGWEHAYYLQYRNDKASWVEAFWSVVDWPAAAERFAARDRTAVMVGDRR